ncbi:MAG: SpoIIE family protein phosphatase, partial [Clostridia bacterium]|nr:SpoIIE family protein phosphatase [Clostridia bacterium]
TKLQGDALPAGALQDARPAVRTVPLQPDDVLLLCSDGLWPQLTDGVQSALVQFLKENTPQAAAESLMSFATAADDALAAVIHVERAG